MKRLFRLLAVAMMGVGLAGCATQVDRVGTEEPIDLTGRWNDTDSRLVSQEMVEDLLSRGWIARHEGRTGSTPTVIVGQIRNLSHEHINTNTFIRDIERELINSGRVIFVAAGGDRDAIRDERQDQAQHARPDTVNPPGEEAGANYMLTGTINTIMDVEGRTEVAYYQVDLALTSLADNTRIWVGQKQIRKVIRRGLFRS
ncbi:MAG: penicillin-binding protein activator LpoB [Ectothiorhodospiraceae bacterium]|nr:penicillin-binding protein activator LpoB [Ectothiorhodospiraceae bacterium]MCH8503678.1 penicillin-binding protein activator LpoB [Ectothiorhodospiraceae bacterium]